LLATVLDRLIPADDGAPGAMEVIGANGFMVALNSPRYAADREAILAWLEQLHQSVGDAPRSPTAWDDLLSRIDAGQEPQVATAPFRRLVTITAELFYGSPAADSSPDRRTPAWDLLGYSPRPQPPASPDV
jgi:hypothetical protein